MPGTRLRGYLSYRNRAHGDLGRATFEGVTILGAIPCHCSRKAVMEKAGQLVCEGCAQMLKGLEYPLRDPLRTVKLRALDRELAYRAVCNPLMLEN